MRIMIFSHDGGHRCVRSVTLRTPKPPYFSPVRPFNNAIIRTS